jgi:iron(III) transport system permease protein
MSLSEFDALRRRSRIAWATSTARVAMLVLAARLFLFPSERIEGLFVTTTELAVTALALALLPSLWFGWRAVHGVTWERRIIVLTMIGLWALPLVQTAAAWEAGFGRRGWLTADAEAFADPWLSGFRAAAFLHAVAAIPWMSLLFAFAFSRTERELREEALISGGPWRAFLFVDLPRTLPALGIAAAWLAVVLFQEMTITDLYQVRTIAEEFYVAIQLRREGSAEVWSLLPEFVLLSIAAVGTLAAFGHWANGDRTRASQDALERPQPAAQPTAIELFACGVTLIGVATLAISPTLNLLYRVGRDVSDAEGEPTPFWSAAKATELLSSAPFEYGSGFAWSAMISVTTAAVVVVFASVIAWWGMRSRVGGIVAAAIVAVLLPLPGPLLALTLVRLLNQPGLPLATWLLDRTIFAPVAACTLRYLPLGIVLFAFLYRRLPAERIEQMELDGAGPFSRWLHSGVLGVRGAFTAALVGAFALAWGDLSAVHLATPPGIETVTQRIFGLLHAGADDQVAALCLWNLAVFLVTAAVAAMMLQAGKLREATD